MSRRAKSAGRRSGSRQGDLRRRDVPASRGSRAGRGSGGRIGRRNDPRVVAGAVVVGLALLAGVFVLGGGLVGTPTAPTPGPADSGLVATCPTSQPPALAAGQTRTVTIQTQLGAIVIKVDASSAPIATGNFVALAGCGFYNGLVFHRTAALQDGTPFVIQGGDPNGNGSGDAGYKIQDEPVTGTYKRGTVAMARSSQPNSQGSQFFIVLDDSAGSILASANPGYAIIGQVSSGMDVADKIFQASNGQELPSNPIPMDSVTVTNP
jgi:cyclophilin family peptidyl-prolyl cis-trans isomerase